MSRPAVPAPVLAALVGGAAFLFYVPFMVSGFDGRARSLLVPQMVWLGWALLMVLAARMPTRRTVGTFLGAAALFYALWGVTFVLTATYFARTVHG